MGFGELFSSHLGVAAKAKASLIGGMSGWLTATLATVQAAAPVMREAVYTHLWRVVDSEKTLVPVTEATMIAVLRQQLSCDKVRQQRCTPASTSRFCSCGGIPGEATPTKILVDEPIPRCPNGRNLCRHGPHCERHGGDLNATVQVERDVLVEAPICPHCQGTGIIPRSEPMAHIRRCWRAQRKTYARPTSPLHEWILEEGGSVGRWRQRCFQWSCHPTHRYTDGELVDQSEWMAAAQILFDNEHCRIYYPRTESWRNPDHLDGGNGAYADWHRLPPSKYHCSQVFSWWHRQNTPGYEEPLDTLADFVKPRMGACSLPIARESRVAPYVWAGSVPEGDFNHFLECCNGLQSSMEEFLELFYDCAAHFDGELEFSLDASERPSRVSGKLGGVQVLLTTPSVCIPENLVSNITEDDFDSLEDEEEDSHIPPFFRDNGLSALYANLVLKHATLDLVMTAPHPDREEVEDQLDHLENKQGGEIITTPAFVKMLKEKRKEVRGNEFVSGSEGRLVRSSDLTLDKRDVFLSNSILENLKKAGIVKSFVGKDPKLTKVCVDMTNQQEIVRYPSKEMCSDTSGVYTGQVFTVLNRPQFKELNKLAEAGWKEAKSVCLNLHIRSYVPVHTPLYVFCVIMWGHSSDAETASLCGAGCYLGDQEAAVLELPLVCSHLGNSLEDFEAYQRSLVLSSVFFGKAGLSGGQPVFGITAVEFTEYMPTSYGGITHERDSWQAMLRNHQGKDKGRFIAGFNVVDALERDKEEPIQMPHLELEPVPRHRPVVRTFTGEGKQPLDKSRSMRIQSFAAFRGGSIPVGRRVDNTAEAIKYELGRASTSELGTSLKGRLDEQSNIRSNDGDFVFVHTIDLPNAVTVGTVLAKIDILEKIKTTHSAVCAEWVQMGYMDRNLKLISHLAPSQFCGVAIWYVFDAYGHIPSDITTTIELDMVRNLSPHIHVLREPTSAVWTIDFHRYCGQSLNFAGRGFCNPYLWVIAATSAQLPWSAPVVYRLEALVTGERYVQGLATEGVLEYPISPKHLRDLDLTLTPRTMAVGTQATTNFPLSFATKQVSASKRVSYSYAAGLLSHFLGVGGILHFKVQCTSSAFVSSRLRVALWGAQITMIQLCQMPHVDVDVGVTASLKIQSPFYATANLGDSDAAFWVTPMSSPMAPEAIESALEYYIQILGIEADTPLCRAINYKQAFGWFTLVRRSTTNKEIALKIPSRIANIEYKEAEVINHVNAFSIMCATTGMQWGSPFALHLDSHMTQADDQKICESHSAGITTEHIGDIKMCGVLATSQVIPFEIGSFAGPVTSGGTPFESENWIRVWSKHWDWFTSLSVSIEVLEGFRFYGRSAGPMTIPS
ncbi:p2 protein [Grapevine Anatolian ringspot virus]|uniref:p2 protein n=2 Tax=Grapevine Anatolian ringspot virus TaxID=223769 RepID=Q6JX06_9SECO|nr:p2 protein [Grapevine Anatolian ringspot virus]AAQ56596.1 p2 protein [Grapevine Anatolian ringspot virus]